jgi:hypothetical protein
VKAWDVVTAAFGNRKLLAVLAAAFAVALALSARPAAAVAPVVTVENALDVEYTTAKVKGEVNPEDHETSFHFEYATQADFSNAQNIGSGSLPEGAGATPVGEDLTGLQPGTVYHLRLVAENVDGPSEAVAASTFETKPVTKPAPGTPQVSAVDGHAATFQATVDPNAPEDNSLLSQAAKDAYATHWWFTCQPSCSFDGPSEGDVPADDDPVTVAADAKGLLGNTGYTVTLHVKNAGGAETSQASFSTSTVAPDVARANLNGVEPGFDTLTILGNVNPNGSQITDCHFVYGIGAAAGNTVPCSPEIPATLETQTVRVRAISGQFRLIFESEATPDIPFNATSAEVQAALEGLPSIGAGNVSVTGGPGDLQGLTPYRIVFVGKFTGEDPPQLEAENGTAPLANNLLVDDNGIGTSQSVRQFSPSGQFKLIYKGEATTTLTFEASAAEVQAALEALPSVGSGQVSVGLFGPGVGENEWGISFVSPGPKLISEPVGLLPGSTKVSTEVSGNRTSVVPVSAGLTGLMPETEYRYKLVASSAAGTDEGPEVPFKTLAAPVEEACANASVRAEQHSTSTECRAFEMVSPQDKNGANVTGEESNVFAATNGNGAVFLSRGGFAGSAGSGRTGFTQYLARRDSAGWATKAITPTPSSTAIQALAGGTDLFYFSDDLSKAVLWGYDMPGQADDVADNDNLYRLDTASGGLETVTLGTQKTGGIGFGDFEGNAPIWGASRDTGVVSFGSTTRLLPAAIQGTRNAYEWDHGVLRLAGILPNGEVAPGGSAPPYEGGGYRESVSSDGSRVLFVSPYEGERQLYMRRNHADTVWISEPEFGSPGNPEGVLLNWVSPDARTIVFTTRTPLLAEDSNSAADIYRYTDGPNPESEGNLELLSGSLPVLSGSSNEGAVLGASEDGNRVYFLVEGARPEIWLSDDGELRRVASGYATRTEEPNGPMAAPGSSRVSADGRFLVYRGTIAATGRDIRKARDTPTVEQLYVYDAERGTLACASCRRDGETMTAVPSQPAANEGGIRKSIKGLRPRLLSADGEVFFSTAERLLPEDGNGVVDTYVYNARTGAQELVSTGKGEHGQWFVNASTSGNDVFLVTNQSLVGADRDTLTDLYDARVGGGFAEPPPPPTECVGETCRNPVSSAPGGASPATARFSGPGNRRCPTKGKRGKGSSKKGSSTKCQSKKKGQPKKGQSKKHHANKHRKGARR